MRLGRSILWKYANGNLQLVFPTESTKAVDLRDLVQAVSHAAFPRPTNEYSENTFFQVENAIRIPLFVKAISA